MAAWACFAAGALPPDSSPPSPGRQTSVDGGGKVLVACPIVRRSCSTSESPACSFCWGGGLASPVGLALWRQPWPGDPALAARQLEQRHRLVFPDLLYVPDTCGGEGVCAMLKNRLEHVRVSVGLAISVRSLRRGPRRPCVSGHRVGCPPVSTLVRSEHSASAALQL